MDILAVMSIAPKPANFELSPLVLENFGYSLRCSWRTYFFLIGYKYLANVGKKKWKTGKQNQKVAHNLLTKLLHSITLSGYLKWEHSFPSAYEVRQ